MPIRPARTYRYFSGPAYTRREYVKGVPGIRVTFFDMGNPKGDFPVEMSLVSQETGQIRHNALEAARIAVNRLLEVKAGKDNYHFKLRVYPHQILRENPMATGAGADRISDGMARAFGRPIGTAARVSSGQKIMSVRVAGEFAFVAKEALRRASLKLPMPSRIVVERGQKLLG
ncbi:MAG: 50S ribosomal protein L16 [Candidatus Hadarchaeaceae archaeon]|nr:50S ribosomal protein L16 [Hadesarchaea archaeon]MDH5685733.1 50S ribosomal protein L16 [Hadesarchaea archaeon]